tara:strand:+ start:77 stop:646 length:570 start_codon:yes stop_codon:yes gene_type:complete
MRIKTSKTEIIDITKSWLIISLAFTIVWFGFNLNLQFLFVYIIAASTAGLGFLLHELAHKLVAQKYGCVAEYRSYDQMLLFALAMSLFGFLFAAPGAVMISGMITRKENGLISAAGPMTNFILAIIFGILAFIIPSWRSALGIGMQINAWLGIFNMIPIWNFDGKKIWAWNPAAWVGMVALGIILMWSF